MDGEECAECGSTDFHDEDGRIFCAGGHDQGRGLATAADDADFGRQGTVVRKKEVKRKQKISKGMQRQVTRNVIHEALQRQTRYLLMKVEQYFVGPRRTNSFFNHGNLSYGSNATPSSIKKDYRQNYGYVITQAISSVDCHRSVHFSLTITQAIVRDLWTLWLSKLEHRLGDSLADTKDKEDTTASSGNETDIDPDVDEKDEPLRRTKSAHSYPTLVDTIAMNYLGIVMLRRPIGLAKILKWIVEEDIPFIRAIRHVPQDMKDRLPGEYHQALDTMHLLGPDDLQKAVYHRARWYDTSFDMIMPPINRNLILFSYIRQLALPLEVYSAALRLNIVTKYDFCYADPTKSSQTTRRQPTTYPESQLIALVVVATKFLFPFDSETVKRYPQDPNDPTTLHVNWPAWLEAKANFNKQTAAGDDHNALKPGSEIHVTDNDVLDMTDQQLDQYMDWYQQTWITGKHAAHSDQAKEQGIEKDILDMFPLHDVPERVKTLAENRKADEEEDSRLRARIVEVQSSLKSRRAISLEEESERGLDILRPGSRYPRYPKIEDLDREPDGGAVVKAFHEEAAETACLSVKALLLAVNRTEEKVEQWLVDRRREEVFGEGMDPGKGEGGGGNGAPLDADEDMDFHPETSPPGKLAREMEGLEIGQSPNVEESLEEVVDTEMSLYS
ncbi:uncharacterized protein Z519_04782 [Cladophialophora bantiana CBS 173.52]|uniref:RRN7-type domain-containing protein n=1 Tax=Cladophialophora bantiana (strain ATCC 10958 / CBS 173.52 / CDC B-1940 / NIH 8579) TaxID=1442370 RepID=A0A0D2HVA6_CLAB1|nr:uncharacterized protein Z519_04782 [Cladophialophora bantiana CBS 173.52]KIW94805.1 hypothetical protein Z519_04782 [Cladophialophora bantiana CBS 173.52]